MFQRKVAVLYYWLTARREYSQFLCHSFKSSKRADENPSERETVKPENALELEFNKAKVKFGIFLSQSLLLWLFTTRLSKDPTGIWWSNGHDRFFPKKYIYIYIFLFILSTTTHKKLIPLSEPCMQHSVNRHTVMGMEEEEEGQAGWNLWHSSRPV